MTLTKNINGLEGCMASSTLIPEPQQADNGQDVYFELLHLQPMQMDISFMRTERAHERNIHLHGLKMKKLEVHILTIVCLLGLWNVEVVDVLRQRHDNVDG
jgi:hypothetical protein